MREHNKRLKERVLDQTNFLVDDFVELSTLNHTNEFCKTEEDKRKIREVTKRIKDKLEILNGILDVM